MVRLSLSAVLNPNCEDQVRLLNLSDTERDEFLVRARSISTVLIPDLPQFDSVKSIVRLCRNGNTGNALIEVKYALSLALKDLQNFDSSDKGYTEKVAETKILRVYEQILDLLSIEPNYFQRSSSEPAPSEHEVVDVVRKMISVLSGGHMSARVGELGTRDLPKGTRRKVDLTLATIGTGIQLSHSEFARFSTSQRKCLADQSKIIRLNQTILNKNHSESIVGLQQRGLIGNLIILKHVDNGLYVVNANTEFSLPSKMAEIHTKMPDLIQKLSFFVVTIVLTSNL
ncbi:hypothetical protein HK100_008678 [Physocladia obscura]|uniref:Uncharacterized protein n=1 Tax=Physocladia obscura TaxID=109957 RepID=A0AAD5T3U2_9FUNG|nr:hypothetical protein HK100_008678 [Physocladia obscura]